MCNLYRMRSNQAEITGLFGAENGAGNLPGMQWNSPNHTNSLMILSAKGDAARLFRPYANLYDPVRGAYIDNTDVAKVVFHTLDPQ